MSDARMVRKELFWTEFFGCRELFCYFQSLRMHTGTDHVRILQAEHTLPRCNMWLSFQGGGRKAVLEAWLRHHVPLVPSG